MTPDARLSAAERAALCQLEAVATAADPRFAARLGGSSGARLSGFVLRVVPLILAWTAGRAAMLARAGWWGAPAVAVGSALVVVGVSAGLVVAVVGALVCAAGLRMLAGLVEARSPRGST